MINLGILVSGSGTNLQAIIDAVSAKRLSAAVKAVISNKPDAKAIERAKKHHIPAFIVQENRFSSKEDYDTHLVEILKANPVDLVILAG
ncbi:MAG TPA: formyltransferase family protein, partial [Thermodesulfobacteriota bacterium]|nr:formyltransferase family protein [Thermodesulfobacteriota bacterium]